jgi:uncharacterized PurR-regulated membrane protein YhhQ (DUF165 family)
MKKFTNDFRDLLHSVPPIIAAMFVISVVCMNLLANKSINTGVEWLALDCGILLSWITFLSLDIMTHCYGPWAATGMSIAAILINLLMAGIFFIAGHVPGVWGESYVEGSEAIINAALDNTFSGTWFILLGSSIAFVVSALVNNFLNYGIGTKLEKEDGFGIFALRSYVSTFIAQFTDNLIFAFLVSRVFFGWTTIQCLTCALTGAVLELLFEVFFSPIGYRIAKGIKKERLAVNSLQEA